MTRPAPLEDLDIKSKEEPREGEIGEIGHGLALQENTNSNSYFIPE